MKINIVIKLDPMGAALTPFVLVGVPKKTRVMERMWIDADEKQAGVHNIKLKKAGTPVVWLASQTVQLEKPDRGGSYRYSLFWFVTGPSKASFKIHVRALKGDVTTISNSLFKDFVADGQEHTDRVILAGIADGEAHSAGHRYIEV